MTFLVEFQWRSIISDVWWWVHEGTCGDASGAPKPVLSAANQQTASYQQQRIYMHQLTPNQFFTNYFRNLHITFFPFSAKLDTFVSTLF